MHINKHLLIFANKPLIILVVLAALCTITADAANIGKRRTELTDSLEHVLKGTRDAKARVHILYNLYDLSLTHTRAATAERLYQQAVVSNDTAAQLESLRLLANVWSNNDSMQAVQLRRAEGLPSSPDQRATLAFIRISRASNAARNLQGDERIKSLHNSLMLYANDQKVDIYRRVEMLATICMFLKERANEKLVLDYIAELEKLIDKLPDSSLALRSTLLTYTALATSKSFRHEDAVKSEAKLLDLIRLLKERHDAEGRKFLSYDPNYYVSYTRMLMNYQALTPAQIEDYHNRILTIAARNEDVAEDRALKGVDEAFYRLARGEYALAAQLLDRAADVPANKSRKFAILNALITAAEAAGNDDLLLKAYRRYLPMVNERNAAIDSDRVIEYQILHDLNTLQSANADLSAQKQLAAIESRNTTIGIVLMALAVVIVLLIITFVAYRHARKLSNKAADALNQLTLERDLLKNTQAELIAARDKATVADRQKTDFINTVSHEISEPVNAILGYTQLVVDAVEDKRRAMLDRFVKIIELNAQLLRTLVNDVLDAAELENGQAVLRYQSMEMHTLCQVAADSLTQQLQPGVDITIRAAHKTPADATVDVDPVRAEQVLVNLVSNAMKFTDKGHIKITYAIDRSGEKATFTVEDTGPGVPQGMEQKIFERFEKLGNYKQGIGLGLYICRMVARMLGGDVCLDRSYSAGARFVFTIPARHGNSRAIGELTAHGAEYDDNNTPTDSEE